MFSRDSCSPGLCWKSEEAQKYKPVYVKKRTKQIGRRNLPSKFDSFRSICFSAQGLYRAYYGLN